MRPLIALLAIPLMTTLAHAQAPSPDCARKFIGTWRHEGATSSNTETLTADGQAICSGNPFCSQGTWSCTGNVAHYRNAGGAWDYTLQPGGQVMQGPGNNRAYRVGATPAAAPAPAPQAARPSIDGNSWLVAARAAEQYCSYADQMVAAGDYLKAADAFAAVGDMRRKAQAEASSQRASARADACEAKGKGRPGRGAPAVAGTPPARDPCEPFQRRADDLARRGVSATQMKALMDAAEKQRCTITYNAPSENPFGSLHE